MPLFSIILPTYNRAHFLPKAIESVTAQTFQDWELIIVDDGSTDNTKEVVGKFKDERINYIYQENAERSAARNNGIRNAKGEYILFLDSDDSYLPNHLTDLQVFIIQNNSPIGLIHYGCLLSQEGKSHIKHEVEIPKDGNLVEFFFTHPIPPLRVCLHRNVTDDFLFDEDIVIVEDICLWMKIATKYKNLFSEHIGVEYFLHADNSVNKANPGAIKMYEGLKIFFNRYPHFLELIRPKVYNAWLSRIMTNIAIYYSLKDQKKNAFWWTIRAIFKKPVHKHTRFRILLLLHILGLKKAPYE